MNEIVPNTGEPIVENGSVGNTISGNQIAPGGLGARAALPEISSVTLSSPTSMSFLSDHLRWQFFAALSHYVFIVWPVCVDEPP